VPFFPALVIYAMLLTDGMIETLTLMLTKSIGIRLPMTRRIRAPGRP
jgi:hypothetical protein